MNTADRSVSRPTPEAALYRQILVGGLGALALIGIGAGGKAAIESLTSSGDNPPVAVVRETIDPYETVWGLAKPYAHAEGVDPRDVVEDIINMSPDLQDGTTNIGDVALVPATQEQIEQHESVTYDPAKQAER